MKQKIIVALLGLAIGGCAQSRSAKLPEVPGAQPVGMEPLPSIHDTINRGASPAVARSTLPDPSNPNWSGHPQPTKRPATGLAPQVATTGRPGAAQTAQRAIAPLGEPPSQLPALEPDVESAQSTASTRSALGDPAISPSSGDRPIDGRGSEEPLDASPLPPVEEADTTPEPSAALAPTAPGARSQPANELEAEDPLLGPNPELMPGLDELVPSDETTPKKSGEPAPLPATAPTPTPTPAPAASTDPATPAVSLEASPLPALSPASESSEPPVALPPAAEPSASATQPNTQSQTLAARSSAPRVDHGVQRVSTAPAAAELASDLMIDPNWKEAGKAAARVGDEVITLRELVVAVKEQVKRHGGQLSQVSREEMNMLAKNILAGLIERSLVVQEAKHQLKSEKQMDRIIEAADKYWKDDGIPPLLRQNMVENEYQLKQKLEESGRSLAGLHQDFRQDFIAQVFVHQKLADKLKVELPEMLKYYNAHINDKENFRPARIVWREVLVEHDRHPSPADARRKAEELLARLQKGEDFAKLAIAESEGPSGVKAAGGLMETSPGSYAVPAVNQAIETLPLSTTSGIIEGPSSFHIVRVESRRPAGQASFSELQVQIRKELYNQKTNNERTALISKLREKTIITTIFDGTSSDPRRIDRD